MEARIRDYRDAIKIIQSHQPEVSERSLKEVEAFAKRFQVRLDSLHMKQSEFAIRAGITPQMVNKLRKGERSRLDREQLYLFAAILGCSPHYLVGEVDEPAMYPSKEGEDTWEPIVPITIPEQKFVDVIRRVAPRDPVFVDYIFQIAENNEEIERAKRILLDAKLVVEREPVEISLWQHAGEDKNSSDWAKSQYGQSDDTRNSEQWLIFQWVLCISHKETDLYCSNENS